MKHKATILVTGFGPFPGMEDNLSGQLATRLAHLAARRFSAHRIVGRVLPTEWEAAPALLAQLYARERPIIALHFGVSDKAQGFSVELRAHNRCGARKDAKGQLPGDAVIRSDGPNALRAQVPVEEIVERLSRLGIPAEISTDAGDYLCNALLYHSLQLAASAEGLVLVGFVHVPAKIAAARSKKERQAAQGDGALSWDLALKGGLEILRTCLGRPPGSQRRLKAR